MNHLNNIKSICDKIYDKTAIHRKFNYPKEFKDYIETIVLKIIRANYKVGTPEPLHDFVILFNHVIGDGWVFESVEDYIDKLKEVSEYTIPEIKLILEMEREGLL